MIFHYRRKELNVKKYDDCIEKSLQSNAYAFSHYLDIVCDNWDVFVLNDYEAVMPIPWKRKYYIKYVTQPAFTQQLGIFSIRKLNEKIVKPFTIKLSKTYFKVQLQLNSNCGRHLKITAQKTNYILEIRFPIDEIYKKFNSNRKRDLKKAIDNSLRFTTISNEEFLNFYENTTKPHEFSLSELAVLTRLIHQLKNGRFIGVKKDDTLLSALFWIENKQKSVYLLPITNTKGKGKGAATFLIYEWIKSIQKTSQFVDFEGSMVNGVANFYKSFGANKEEYYVFASNFNLL